MDRRTVAVPEMYLKNENKDPFSSHQLYSRSSNSNEKFFYIDDGNDN
jgi:hypothetical protein